MRPKNLLLLTLIFTGGLFLTERYDHELFFFLNCAPDVPMVKTFMLSLTQLADGAWVIMIAMILFPRRQGLVLALILAFLISGGIVQAFKAAWPQPRPTVLFRAMEELCVLGLRNTNSSFPSGHATAAMVLARFLAEGGSQLRVALMLALGSLMALSRVYVGVHFPADIWAGAWLGWMVTDATLRFFRHKKPVGDYFLRGALASGFGFLLATYFIFFHQEKIPEVKHIFIMAAAGVAVLLALRTLYYSLQWGMDLSIRRRLFRQAE